MMSGHSTRWGANYLVKLSEEIEAANVKPEDDNGRLATYKTRENLKKTN